MITILARRIADRSQVAINMVDLGFQSGANGPGGYVSLFRVEGDQKRIRVLYREDRPYTTELRYAHDIAVLAKYGYDIDASGDVSIIA